MRARPRIAYVSSDAILPPNRGGRIRAHHLWRAMSAYAEVVPIIIGDAGDPMPRSQARHAGAVIMPRRRYHTKALQRSLRDGGLPSHMPGLWEALGAGDLPEEVWAALADEAALTRHCLNPNRIERLLIHLRRLRPDLIVLNDAAMGAIAPYARALGVPVVVGPYNYDSDLYGTIAALVPDEARQRWFSAAATAFAAAERGFVRHADQLWVCSRADAARFAALAPEVPIRVVPNVFDIGMPTPLPQTRDLVFVGQASYYPNEDAALRLMEVSRGLDRRGVEHRMRIVGRTNAVLREAAGAYPSVEVTGEVPQVGPYVEQAFLVPIALTLGGGTRLKILEALSMARPVLSTPVGIEGIEVESGVHAIVEPDLHAFPEQIEALLNDRDRAQAMALKGWEFARDTYSHEALVRIVGAALRDLGLGAAAPGAACFAANIGARVTDDAISFNPHTRLLSWSFLLRLSAGFEALTAEFDAEGAPDLPNAFVTLKPRRRGYVLVEANAVLPADVAPEALAIQIHAWGRPVLRHPVPAVIPEERAGLLSLEPGVEGVTLLGWTMDPDPAVLPEPLSLDEVGAGGLPRIFQARLDITQATPAVSVTPADGIGQSLTQPFLWTAPRPPSSARLRALAGRHAGETAWLVGNGPSVRIEDLDALAGKLTFCFNRFHLAHDRTKLRASYTVSGDRQMIEDFGQEIVDRSGGTVFVADEHAPELLGGYIWVRQAAIYPSVFSRRADHLVSPGGSSLYVAMQLGYLMGVRNFYIYGADFEFRFEKTFANDPFRIASGEGNHFIADYRGGRPWCPPSLRDIGAGFHIARRVMEAEDGFVRNASRGGRLEMFAREEFDAAVAGS
ncbi:glycosyltransferase involved in cell wall biosynthesis [Humitalea rosea]|uniref:Glycosyltransferase involved in cell wall biosynthesis n=1 Tax=Humitalea rosea TaxID=990373 RepID=A0A2W7IDG1_9PROT|nr:glycosyltransferase [Humitalea rosea]PZW43065.1 glycosyltransferase involved in cell wall biosynthesis [Humitalea rosea]